MTWTRMNQPGSHCVYRGRFNHLLLVRNFSIVTILRRLLPQARPEYASLPSYSWITSHHTPHTSRGLSPSHASTTCCGQYLLRLLKAGGQDVPLRHRVVRSGRHQALHRDHLLGALLVRRLYHYVVVKRLHALEKHELLLIHSMMYSYIILNTDTRAKTPRPFQQEL